jgi:DNA-binding Xre family transcriptional regulator
MNLLRLHKDHGVVGGVSVKFSYKKLWHLLIDRDISKGEFRKLAGISSATSSKLTRGESVTTGVLLRICNALKCDTSDIMEVLPSTSDDINVT